MINLGSLGTFMQAENGHSKLVYIFFNLYYLSPRQPRLSCYESNSGTTVTEGVKPVHFIHYSLMENLSYCVQETKH